MQMRINLAKHGILSLPQMFRKQVPFLSSASHSGQASPILASMCVIPGWQIKPVVDGPGEIGSQLAINSFDSAEVLRVQAVFADRSE